MRDGIIMELIMTKDGKNKETLYSLLGLSGEEPIKYIAARYNNFLQEHADHNLSDKNKTKSLAYEILVDPTTRVLYDAANPRKEVKVKPNFDISKVKLSHVDRENDPHVANGVSSPIKTPLVKPPKDLKITGNSRA